MRVRVTHGPKLTIVEDEHGERLQGVEGIWFSCTAQQLPTLRLKMQSGQVLDFGPDNFEVALEADSIRPRELPSQAVADRTTIRTPACSHREAIALKAPVVSFDVDPTACDLTNDVRCTFAVDLPHAAADLIKTYFIRHGEARIGLFETETQIVDACNAGRWLDGLPRIGREQLGMGGLRDIEISRIAAAIGARPIEPKLLTPAEHALARRNVEDYLGFMERLSPPEVRGSCDLQENVSLSGRRTVDQELHVYGDTDVLARRANALDYDKEGAAVLPQDKPIKFREFF